MDERRPDHFAHLKHAPEAPLPDGSQPTATPSLVEYLEAQFPVPQPRAATSLDDAIRMAAEGAQAVGEQRVIAAIRQLIRGA